MSMKTLPSTAMSRAADYVRTAHHVNIDPSATIEDILRPSFWAHHVARLNVNDLVDVMTTDGGIDIQLRVIEKGIGFVVMRPLRIWTRDEGLSAGEGNDTSAASEALGDVPEGYTVGHTPKTSWRVLTKEPNLEVSRNHKSKAEAINAAIAHAAKANGIAA
jgi:hypothetical protein